MNLEMKWHAVGTKVEEVRDELKEEMARPWNKS